MTDTKPYEVEKKKRYEFSDYDSVLTEFNIRLIEFLDNICDICKENKWSTEIIDIGAYITTIQTAIKADKKIAIKTFSQSVYPFYNYIKSKNEKMLLNNNYSEMVDVTIILKYKNLWLESGEEN